MEDFDFLDFKQAIIHVSILGKMRFRLFRDLQKIKMLHSGNRNEHIDIEFDFSAHSMTDIDYGRTLTMAVFTIDLLMYSKPTLLLPFLLCQVSAPSLPTTTNAS
ncbi:unnamed protein product, partial [Amoebophrya sp. A25]|eukprot:GSA25T00007291001.1